MEDSPYRPGANAFVIDNEGKFLIVQKQSYGDNQWDTPGGGLEDNESPEIGVLRELKEELGTDKFEIITSSPIKLKFDWPKEIQATSYQKYGKNWIGQEKQQFIVRFTGNKKDIAFNKDELRKIKWVSYPELKDHLIFEGQWENAKEALEASGYNAMCI